MTKKKIAYLTLLCVVATAAALGLSRATASSNTASDLLGFPNQPPAAAELTPLGVALTSPHGAVPSSPTAAAAAGTAAANAAGAKAISEMYAHCVDTSSVPAVDQDCWVVNLDPGPIDYPGALPGDGTPPPAKWAIAFVDPATNKPIEGLSSSN